MFPDRTIFVFVISLLIYSQQRTLCMAMQMLFRSELLLAFQFALVIWFLCHTYCSIAIKNVDFFGMKPFFFQSR